MFQRLFKNAFVFTALGALLVLAISAWFKPETLPAMQVCAFKQLTGRPCPGCGMTRAFCAISHGRIGDAMHFNPFGFVFYFGAVMLALWPLLSALFPKFKAWVQHTNFFVYVLPGLLVAMLLFGVARIFVGSDV